MNRKDFGKLVKALRKEQRDSDDKFCTQKMLAKKTNLSIRMIGKIENGRQVKLDTDTLLELANAFKLTTMERKEFFFAAAGVERENVPQQRRDSSSLLKEQLEHLEEIQLPAFIHDAYGDIIAANESIIRFLNISTDFIKQGQAANNPISFNIMHIISSKESMFHNTVGNKLDRIIDDNMLYFRYITLRYRAKDHFHDIFNELSKNPSFSSSWYNASDEENKVNSHHAFYDYVPSEYEHQVKYTATISKIITNFGELYLVVLVPTSKKTLNIFNEIIDEVGTNIRELTPWPKTEKKMP